MEFATLYDFMVHTKSWTYILMGLTLAGLWLFWHFLTGRDDTSIKP